MTKLAHSLCLAAALMALAACTKAGGEGDGDDGRTPPATAEDAASPAAATAKLGAGGPMAQKPGLWKMVQTLPNMPNAAIATKVCVDPDMAAKMATFGMNNKVSDSDCTHTSVVQTAGGADVTMTCTKDGRTSDIKMHVERISDVEFKQTMDLGTGVAGRETMSMSTHGTWLGACPEGMKGGEFSVDTGAAGNMHDIMAAVKSKHTAN